MTESLAVGDVFVSKVEFLYAPPDRRAPVKLQILAVNEKSILVAELYPQENDLGEFE